MAGYPAYSFEGLAAREALKNIDRNSPTLKQDISDIARKINSRYDTGFLGQSGEYAKQFANAFGEELRTTLPTTLARAGTYAMSPLALVESLYGGNTYSNLIDDIRKANQYGNVNDRYISNEMQAARAALGEIGADALGYATGIKGLSVPGKVVGALRGTALSPTLIRTTNTLGPVATAANMAPVLFNPYKKELEARNIGFSNASELEAKREEYQKAIDAATQSAGEEASKWYYKPYVGYGAGAGLGALGGYGISTLLGLKTPGKVLSTIGGGVAGGVIGRYIQSKVFKDKINEIVRKYLSK